jgi:hypothetical protein
MFTAPSELDTTVAHLERNVLACFGIAGFCLASPYFQRSAHEWLSAGLRQLLELREIIS